MKNYKIFWTHNATIDLEEIIEYIFQDRQTVAIKIYNDIKHNCKKLKTQPKRNRIVPELQNIGINNYREIIYKTYRIIYKLDEKEIYIIAVVDSRRDFETFIFNRLIRK